MTALSPMTAARRICAGRGWGVTNLELQKMLYLGQLLHLGEHGERLLNGEFEAWDYGPVQPIVYREARIYGSAPIRFLPGSIAEADPAREATLKQVIEQLSKMSAGQLVSITHWNEGAWANNYRPGLKGVVIPDRDIIEEYRKRAERQKARRGNA
jgi:uncharacterized phage-associated protein